MSKRFYFDEFSEDIFDDEIQQYPSNQTICNILNQQQERISELEEQLKNAIVLPKELQIGNKVYFIDVEENHIHKGKIYSITKELNYEENGFITWVYCRYDDGLTFTHPIRDYGVELFATKAEAKAKLKELKDRVYE